MKTTSIGEVRDLIDEAEERERQMRIHIEELESEKNAIEELLEELEEELKPLKEAQDAYENMNVDRVSGIINELEVFSKGE